MYKAVEYKVGGTTDAPKAYGIGDVIVPSIPIRSPGKGAQMTVFVNYSAGAGDRLELYESVDGVTWVNARALAEWHSTGEWSFITFQANTAGDYPAGTLLQLRCVTGGVTVDRVLVVQDW